MAMRAFEYGIKLWCVRTVIQSVVFLQEKPWEKKEGGGGNLRPDVLSGRFLTRGTWMDPESVLSLNPLTLIKKYSYIIEIELYLSVYKY